MTDRIIANRIITPDGTVLQSYNRHDFKGYKDKNGHTYYVDGGLDYLKRSYDKDAPPAREASVYDDDSHAVIREAMHWGTRGKDGRQELHYISLKDMETDHIEACLETQTGMAEQFRKAMENELLWRKDNSSTK